MEEKEIHINYKEVRYIHKVGDKTFLFETYEHPLRTQIEQLKQQLHDLPKKIVEEIKKELYDCGKTYLEDEPYIEICIVKGILDRILKKFGGN